MNSSAEALKGPGGKKAAMAGKTYGYEYLKQDASRLRGHVRIKVALPVALHLAEQAPYPRAVKLGIMKQVANSQYITLSQLQIILGWASDRAQR